MPDRKPTLYLVDSHSLIFQVFFAIREMSAPSGMPTNALFGFTRDMLFLESEKKPDCLVCAFDVEGPTFRDELYPAYKAERPPIPDDLLMQIDPIQELLAALHIPVVGVPGYEADDVIATLAVEGEKEGFEVFICSSDKDCRQLLDDSVRIYNLRKREVFDCDSLMADWGITPEQAIDFQTMVGDSVDNIRGVPGIGPKTAAKLLQEFHSLDNILANIDKIPGKKKQENFEKAKPDIPLMRQLLRLATDVPIEPQWETWQKRDWDGPRLLELFDAWNFRRFRDQVLDRFPNLKKSNPGGDGQGDLFSDLEDPTSDQTVFGRYHLVNTEKQLSAFLEDLRQQRRIAFDLETTGIQTRQSDIVGFAFCWKPGEAWYLPVRGMPGDIVLPEDLVLAELKPTFESAAIGKVNQNIKFDWLVLRDHGVNVKGVAGDPMIADYLLHAEQRRHNIEELAEAHLNHHVIPITDLIGKGKKQKRIDQVPVKDVAEYAGEDADVAYRLCDKLEPELQRLNFKRPNEPSSGSRPHVTTYLYDDLEIPLIEVLTELEFNGIRLDVPFLQAFGAEMELQLSQLQQDIFTDVGHEFNIASVPQLRAIMYEELGFPTKGKTAIRGDASTDQETLEWLAREGVPDHPLPARLLTYRQLSKLKGTYVDALPNMVNPKTGRVHASFNQTVAATGRLSSSDPNLQNIPIRTDVGEKIRRAFIPEEGWHLVAADYSQIELRFLAHFCGDEALREAFAQNHDIHTLVAAQIFDVPESGVTKEMRRVAKTVNFGVIYGMSAWGLGQRLQIPNDEAAKFIDLYFGRYPKVLEYQDRLLTKCQETGYVSTILGRRRQIALPKRRFFDYRHRSRLEREAINMEIQGSAADLIKIAMLNIFRKLRDEKKETRLLLQIHDELVFETPPGELDDAVELIRDEMTAALADQIEVALQVDVGFGPNWLELQPVAAV